MHSGPGRSPEDQFLLKCATAGLHPGTSLNSRELFEKSLDWGQLVKRAITHGVAPLVCWSLKKAKDRILIPEDIFLRLEKTYYATGASNLKLLEKLKVILESFEEAGIRVLVLKGPVLAAITYPNMAVRPISDLDLLILPEDYPRVCKVLEALGYKLAPSIPVLEGSEVVEYAHYFSQVRFLGKDGTVVETHFCLLNMGVPREDTQVIWQRSVQFEGLGFKAQRPSLEDMLIHLCLHAIQHNFSKLLYFCDIASLLQSHGTKLDWTYLTNAARMRRMYPLVYYTLSICKELLDANVPAEVLSELKPRLLRRKGFETIWDINRVLALEKKKRPSAIEAVFCSLAEIDDFQTKLFYLWRVCFPRRKWLSAYFSRPVTSTGYIPDLSRYLMGNMFASKANGKSR